MISIRNAARVTDVDVRRLRQAATKLLRVLDETNSGLSISLVRDDEIRRLNREHRGKDKPTDVLSFPLKPEHQGGAGLPERLLGDVVISVETARRQAAEYDASLQNEVYRLLIHGMLHVLGYDHQRPRERAAMVAEECRLAHHIGMPWPYA